MRTKLTAFATCCILIGLLQGCAAAVIGGTAAGVAVAHDRRTAGTFVEDRSIQMKAVNALRADRELWEQVYINVTTYNKAVLLTGQAPSEALRARAEQHVRQIEHVERVHNELTIAAPASLTSRSADTLTTGKVKTSLLGVRDLEGFDATRVKVVTASGTVYLMGLVTREEAEAATDRARQVGGVQRVVRIFDYL
jgi:osmotically-inducible protein OsmY